MIGTNRSGNPATCTTRNRLAVPEADLEVEVLGRVVHRRARQEPAGSDEVTCRQPGSSASPTMGIRASGKMPASPRAPGPPPRTSSP